MLRASARKRTPSSRQSVSFAEPIDAEEADYQLQWTLSASLAPAAAPASSSASCAVNDDNDDNDDNSDGDDEDDENWVSYAAAASHVASLSSAPADCNEMNDDDALYFY